MKENRKQSLFDYLFVLRPILLVPVWTMLLAGHYRAGGISRMTWRLPEELWLMIALYSGLMGAVYIVNQIYDVETDRLNKKLFLVAEGYVSKTAIIIEAMLLFALAIAFSFLKYAPVLGWLVAASGLLGLLYSVPRFKFKARPFLDMLANGIGYGGLAFATGWMATGACPDNVLTYSLPYVLAVSAVYLNTTLPDYQSDKATGNVTTGVFLGGKATAWLALALMTAAAALSWRLHDNLCLVASACALPLFLITVITQKMKWVMLSYQGGALLLVALIGLMFPVLFVMLIVTYAALKYYHKWRFNMNYPRLADRG
ncbi:MAG: UbiA family prenyltransferase [Candidatus Edwardsbacteria bacterium]|nr:UbiA family prenyltransferase [Candidatus Edwardsbacteria bacterium]